MRATVSLMRKSLQLRGTEANSSSRLPHASACGFELRSQVNQLTPMCNCSEEMSHVTIVYSLVLSAENLQVSQGY